LGLFGSPVVAVDLVGKTGTLPAVDRDWLTTSVSDPSELSPSDFVLNEIAVLVESPVSACIFELLDSVLLGTTGPAPSERKGLWPMLLSDISGLKLKAFVSDLKAPCLLKSTLTSRVLLSSSTSA
jgi:hypothetical protein